MMMAVMALMAADGPIKPGEHLGSGIESTLVPEFHGIDRGIDGRSVMAIP